MQYRVLEREKYKEKEVKNKEAEESTARGDNNRNYTREIHNKHNKAKNGKANIVQDTQGKQVEKTTLDIGYSSRGEETKSNTKEGKE